MYTRRNVVRIARTVFVWLATAYLVMVFVRAGVAKFSDGSGWARAFAAWGFPVWFRVLVGGCEVLGAALLLYPRTAAYGAAMLALVMLGAMGTHVWDGHPSQVTSEVLPLAVSLLVLALRRRQAHGVTPRARPLAPSADAA